MITPAEIRQRCSRLLIPALQAWVSREPYFPRTFPVGPLARDFSILRQEVEKLAREACSEEKNGRGYQLLWHQRTTTLWGQQTLPRQIVIPELEDLLALADMSDVGKKLMADVTLIRSQLPQLNDWLAPNLRKLIAHHQQWPDLIKVCLYFLAHPRPGLSMRELPIQVDTKFIEQHQSILKQLLLAILPAQEVFPEGENFEEIFGLIREELHLSVRFLDNQLARTYGLPYSDLTLPCAQFALHPFPQQTYLIVENKKTFLRLPPLANVIALWGEGFQVVKLAQIPWLGDCRLFYWGDLDAHGFQILAQLREHFPTLRSLLMDTLTFQTFETYCVPGAPHPGQILSTLTTSEQELYLDLATRNLRLEQERLTPSYIKETLTEHLKQ